MATERRDVWALFWYGMFFAWCGLVVWLFVTAPPDSFTMTHDYLLVSSTGAAELPFSQVLDELRVEGCGGPVIEVSGSYADAEKRYVTLNLHVSSPATPGLKRVYDLYPDADNTLTLTHTAGIEQDRYNLWSGFLQLDATGRSGNVVAYLDAVLTQAQKPHQQICVMGGWSCSSSPPHPPG